MTLGLALPVTIEDVEAAYRDKVKTVHPDVGGDAEQFKALEQAYQQALEYAGFRAGRARWLAAQVERYMAQEVLLAELERRGAQVEMESIDWMQKSLGADFAQLLDQIGGLRLTGPSFDDATMDFLADHRDLLAALHTIDLSESTITDRGMVRLMAFPALRNVTARQTAITPDGLQVIDALPLLETLDVRGMDLGWLSAWKLRHSHRQVTIVT